MQTIKIVNTIELDVPDYGQHLPMEKLQELVKRSGSHFFDPHTLRWFRSKIDSYTIAGPDGWYFVTSEQQTPDYRTGRRYPRLYTVRCLRIGERDNGSQDLFLYELEGFQAFKTLETARTAARQASRAPRQLCARCHLRLSADAAQIICNECLERQQRTA